MSENLQSLIERLNPLCRKAMEEAAELCVSQTNFTVEVEHLLLRIMDMPGCDFDLILNYYDVEPSKVQAQLTDAMSKFKRGNSRTPSLSLQIPQLLQEAWVRATLKQNATSVRSGVIMLALLEDEMLRQLVVQSVPLLLTVPREQLAKEMLDITSSSLEAGGSGAPSVERPKGGFAVGEALSSYTVDLTEQARQGNIDPIFGRDEEIGQLIDILMRRRQNNPILTGEAGVGKTAVVEGFAARIAEGHVPPALKDVVVRVLDLGLLQAGAGMKGEFENRLKSVISEVGDSPVPIILFIDEAHTLIGAGGSEGQGDAANLLKPALARGELRTIAATTWAEYKKYFEKDPALTRRFQVVKVEEPTEDVAITMLRGLVPKLEAHHGVRILDEAIQDAVKLSHRYITGRQLPDKAISVLDTVCARVAIAQSSMPGELEAIERDICRTNGELEHLQREQKTGLDHDQRIEELNDEISAINEKRLRLEGRWQQEKDIVVKIQALEKELEDMDVSMERENRMSELNSMRLELDVVQGEAPLVLPCVNGQVVASVISGWTGIPVGKMMTDEIEGVLALRERLAERVIGQAHAIDAIARRVQTSRAGLDEPDKPVGVFLMVGPSGVGKTETAIALAEYLYGGERKMITINMSEYQEAHSVSNLKGAPPGYVGYGSGGVLTEAVRRNPYSVVLLDEIEKAHPDVMEMFYQVFDKGSMEDSEGVYVDFKNTIILLTSNLGSDTITAASAKSKKGMDMEALVEKLRPEIIQHLKPALVGRLIMIPYLPLGDVQIREIVVLKLAKIQERFWANTRTEFTYDAAIIEAITERCTETETGARNIDNILTHTLLPEMSIKILNHMMQDDTFQSIHVSLDDEGGFQYEFLSSDGLVD